jgi:hypothetical protein
VRLWHQDGVRAALVECEEPLLRLARSVTHKEFAEHCRRFAVLAAPALAEADRAATHERRDARLRVLPDGRCHLHAQLSGVQGAAMRAIFERFVAREYRGAAGTAGAAGAAGGDGLGDARTPAHVRADALFALFQAAAATPADARRPEPLVDVVVTGAEFEAILEAAAGPGEVRFDPHRFDTARIETRDGTILTPREVFEAAVDGWVRRVVVDPAGHVIDLGHRQRLFTGAAREAALHAARQCAWASGSCRVGARSVQVDHVVAARRGGPTDQANASPHCGFHNRFKERGYRLGRDPGSGRWITYRPDGTPVVPPPPPR